LVTTYFELDPTLQYGRRLWIPAQSQLTTWHPVKVPPLEKPDQLLLELRSQVLSTAGGREYAAVNERGAMRFDHAFRAAYDEPIAVVIAPPKSPEKNPLHPDVQDFVLTARANFGAHRNSALNPALLRDPLMTAAEELLDAVDQLVIADDRILPDAAAISAIRRWVVSGGRLWIMAETISPELLIALLGDEAAVSEVDRVDLTSIRMTAGLSTGNASAFTRELDHPVRFVRTIVEEMTVAFEIDGWPAAFWKPFGQGRILVTTVGPDAWLELRPPGTATGPRGERKLEPQSAFVPGKPLADLGLEFFVPRKSSPLPRDIAENQVREMIGYAIPGRPLVLGTLSLFTILMLAGAVELKRRGRLELMGLAIPGLAIVSSGVLLGAGFSNRSRVPASTAVVQWVEAVPGTDEIRTSGVAGVFSKESDADDLSGSQGGWLTLDPSGLETTTRRIVWTDMDRWRWENLGVKPGLRMTEFQTAGRAEPAIEAVATFDARGVAGTWSFPTGLAPADAVIATSQGRMGVEFGDDGAFKSEIGAVLGADQYLSALVLSDEQQRRRRVLSGVLSTAPVQEPVLFLWTKPWGAGSSLVRGDQTVGSALVAVPLRWQRPPPGSPVSIPPPFLPFREIIGPDGLAPSGLYDPRNSEWVERTGATASWLAFAVPEHLLPLDVNSATVTLKVRGALGRLELSTVADGRRDSIKVWDNPVGTLTHTMTDSNALKLDSRGRLLIRLDIGRSGSERPAASPPETESSTDEPQTATSRWQFEEVSLQVSAEIPGQKQ
jgi:hypothetical protein